MMISMIFDVFPKVAETLRNVVVYEDDSCSP